MQEAATVALGMLRSGASTGALESLMTDSLAGRVLLGGVPHVPADIRGFAAVVLGLYAYDLDPKGHKVR
ncbi:MAG: hypothetical protein ACI97A_003069 [Planctomycetota bacterium]